ncbi:LysM peptidoglycan-binding domain-containing protein [Saccharopolyspora shandongensis]|uniref:LysM peptidoglycan-binding domain-containing protein n=1 Tax=Saccharopolyspora shandongensis TaxID=418495 RepID=UPI0033FA581B
MKDTIQKPTGTRASAAEKSRGGPMGFGNGPVIAAGVMAGGAVLFAGWGLTQIVTADDAAAHKDDGTMISAPAEPDKGPEDGTVTVTLPDSDRNGIPDAFEGKDKAPGDDGKDPITGRGDENEPSESDARGEQDRPEEPAKKPETWAYVIQPGDTLIEISGETGVPLDILVEANKIQNPNLIYAGASLLIPPVR